MSTGARPASITAVIGREASAGSFVTELPGRFDSASVPSSPLHPEAGQDLRELMRVATTGSGGTPGDRAASRLGGSGVVPPSSQQLLRNFEAIVSPMETVNLTDTTLEGAFDAPDRRELVRAVELKDAAMLRMMKRDEVMRRKMRMMVEKAHRRFVAEHELAMRRKEENHTLQMHVLILQRQQLDRHEVAMLLKEHSEVGVDGALRSEGERRLHRALLALSRDNELLVKTNETLRERVVEIGFDMDQLRRTTGESLMRVFSEAVGPSSQMTQAQRAVQETGAGLRKQLHAMKVELRRFGPAMLGELRSSFGTIQRYIHEAEEGFRVSAGKELTPKDRAVLDALEVKVNKIHTFLAEHIGLFHRARDVVSLVKEMRGVGAAWRPGGGANAVNLRQQNIQAMLRIFTSLHEALQLVLGPGRAQEAGVDFPLEDGAADAGTIDQATRLSKAADAEFDLMSHLRDHAASLQQQLEDARRDHADELQRAVSEVREASGATVASLRSQLDQLRAQLIDAQVRAEQAQKARLGSFMLKSSLSTASAEAAAATEGHAEPSIITTNGYDSITRNAASSGSRGRRRKENAALTPTVSPRPAAGARSARGSQPSAQHTPRVTPRSSRGATHAAASDGSPSGGGGANHRRNGAASSGMSGPVAAALARALAELREGESTARLDFSLQERLEWADLRAEALAAHNQLLRRMVFLDRWRADTGAALDTRTVEAAVSDLLDREQRMVAMQRAAQDLLTKAQAGEPISDEDEEVVGGKAAEHRAAGAAAQDAKLARRLTRILSLNPEDVPLVKRSSNPAAPAALPCEGGNEPTPNTVSAPKSGGITRAPSSVKKQPKSEVAVTIGEESVSAPAAEAASPSSHSSSFPPPAAPAAAAEAAEPAPSLGRKKSVSGNKKVKHNAAVEEPVEGSLLQLQKDRKMLQVKCASLEQQVVNLKIQLGSSVADNDEEEGSGASASPRRTAGTVQTDPVRFADGPTCMDKCVGTQRLRTVQQAAQTGDDAVLAGLLEQLDDLRFVNSQLVSDAEAIKGHFSTERAALEQQLDAQQAEVEVLSRVQRKPAHSCASTQTQAPAAASPCKLDAGSTIAAAAAATDQSDDTRSSALAGVSRRSRRSSSFSSSSSSAAGEEGHLFLLRQQEQQYTADAQELQRQIEALRVQLAEARQQNARLTDQNESSPVICRVALPPLMASVAECAPNAAPAGVEASSTGGGAAGATEISGSSNSFAFPPDDAGDCATSRAVGSSDGDVDGDGDGGGSRLENDGSVMSVACSSSAATSARTVGEPADGFEGAGGSESNSAASPFGGRSISRNPSTVADAGSRMQRKKSRARSQLRHSSSSLVNGEGAAAAAAGGGGGGGGGDSAGGRSIRLGRKKSAIVIDDASRGVTSEDEAEGLRAELAQMRAELDVVQHELQESQVLVTVGEQRVAVLEEAQRAAAAQAIAAQQERDQLSVRCQTDRLAVEAAHVQTEAVSPPGELLVSASTQCTQPHTTPEGPRAQEETTSPLRVSQLTTECEELRARIAELEEAVATTAATDRKGRDAAAEAQWSHPARPKSKLKNDEVPSQQRASPSQNGGDDRRAVMSTMIDVPQQQQLPNQCSEQNDVQPPASSSLPSSPPPAAEQAKVAQPPATSPSDAESAHADVKELERPEALPSPGTPTPRRSHTHTPRPHSCATDTMTLLSGDKIEQLLARCASLEDLIGQLQRRSAADRAHTASVDVMLRGADGRGAQLGTGHYGQRSRPISSDDGPHGGRAADAEATPTAARAAEAVDPPIDAAAAAAEGEQAGAQRSASPLLQARTALLATIFVADAAAQAAPVSTSNVGCSTDGSSAPPQMSVAVMTELTRRELEASAEHSDEALAAAAVELRQLRQELAAAQRNAEAQQDVIEVKERFLVEANLTNRELEIKLEEMREEYNENVLQLRRQSTNLQRSLAAMEGGKELRARAGTHMAERIKELEQQIAELERRAAADAAAIAERDAQMRLAKHSMAGDSEEILALKERLHEERARRLQLDEELGMVKSASTNPLAVMQAAEAATKRAATAEANNVKLTERLRDAASEVRELEAQVAKATADGDAAVAEVRAAGEQAAESLRATLEGLQEQLVKRQKEGEVTQKALHASMKLTSERDKEIKDLTELVAQLRSAIAMGEAHQGREKEQNAAERNGLLQQLDAARRAATERAHEFHITLDDLTREIAGLKAALELRQRDDDQRDAAVFSSSGGAAGEIESLLNAELEKVRRELVEAQLQLAMQKKHAEAAAELHRRGPRRGEGGVPPAGSMSDAEQQGHRARLELHLKQEELRMARETAAITERALLDKLGAASRERDALAMRLRKAEGNMGSVEPALLQHYGFMSRADLITALGVHPAAFGAVRTGASLLPETKKNEVSGASMAADVSEEGPFVAFADTASAPQPDAGSQPADGSSKCGLATNDDNNGEALSQQVAALQARVVSLLAELSSRDALIERLQVETGRALTVDEILAHARDRSLGEYGSEQSKWAELYAHLAAGRSEQQLMPEHLPEPRRSVALWLNAKFAPSPTRSDVVLPDLPDPSVLAAPMPHSEGDNGAGSIEPPVAAVLLGRSEYMRKLSASNVPHLGDTLHSPSFDAAHFAGRGSALPNLVLACVLSYRAVASVPLRVDRLQAFLSRVTALYNDANPFTNTTHAALAVHTLHLIFSRSPAGKFSGLEMLVGFVAAACVGVVGLGAQSEVLAAEETTAAAIFLGDATQQRVQGAVVTVLLQHLATDFTADMSHTDRAAVRGLLQRAFLEAFAPAAQRRVVARLREANTAFDALIHSGCGGGGDNSGAAPAAHRQVSQRGQAASSSQLCAERTDLLLALLRLCDVGIHVRSKAQYHRSAAASQQELWAVGDSLRARGRPLPSPVLDRCRPDAVQPLHAAIFDFIVSPLLEQLAPRHIPDVLAGRAAANGRFWHRASGHSGAPPGAAWAQVVVAPWAERDLSRTLRLLTSAETRSETRGTQTKGGSSSTGGGASTAALVAALQQHNRAPGRSTSPLAAAPAMPSSPRVASPSEPGNSQSSPKGARGREDEGGGGGGGGGNEATGLRVMLDDKRRVVDALAAQCAALHHRLLQAEERRDFLAASGVKGEGAASPTPFAAHMAAARRPRWVSEAPPQPSSTMTTTTSERQLGPLKRPEMPPWAAKGAGPAVAEQLPPVRVPLANPPPGRDVLAGPRTQPLPAASRLHGANTRRNAEARTQSKWAAALGL